MRPQRRGAARRVQGRGFSLIELLVSMAIGLVLTVAIASVMVGAENDKRGSTSVNDLNQSGSYAAYVLDRQIRNAGSGFAQGWSNLIGCTITAQNAATSGAGIASVLPRAAFSSGSPFYNWTANSLPLTLAPVVIGKNLADPASGSPRGDLLMVMAGTGGFVEVPASVLPGITSGSMRLNNTLGFRTGDLVLIADPSAVPGKCMVEQVGTFTAGPSSTSGSADQVLPFATTAPAATNAGSNYYKQTIGSLNVTSFATTSSGLVAQLGNNIGNLPQFSLIGVGANATLYSNDLLPSGQPDDLGQAIADDVVELHALYGTVPYPAASTNPVAPTWTDPGSAGYTAASLLVNNDTARRTLHGIVAVRLGLVLRTPIGEQKPVSGKALALFSGLSDASGNSLTYSPACGTSGPPYYRCRTVELTIPLRNVIAAP